MIVLILLCYYAKISISIVFSGIDIDRSKESEFITKSEKKMTDIKLVYKGKRQLKPLVEAALANQLRLLQAGIRQTEERLKKFENQFQMNTQDFISRYENDEIRETLDKGEWIGEARLLKRLQEKAETIRDIRFEN